MAWVGMNATHSSTQSEITAPAQVMAHAVKAVLMTTEIADAEARSKSATMTAQSENTSLTMESTCMTSRHVGLPKWRCPTD